VLVPIAIYVALLSTGVFLATRWLPSLAPGRAAGLAFFAVCGLLGGSLAIVGLRLYLIVEEIGAHDGLPRIIKRQAIGEGLVAMLWQAGLLLGLALTVYLLAPAAHTSEDRRRSGDE